MPLHRAASVGVLLALAALLAGCAGGPAAPAPDVLSSAAESAATAMLPSACPALRDLVAEDRRRIPPPGDGATGTPVVTVAPSAALACRYRAPLSIRATVSSELLDAEDAGRYAAVLNAGARPVFPGAINCPADDGSRLELYFSDGSRLERIGIDLSGCRIASNGSGYFEFSADADFPMRVPAPAP